MNDVNEHSLYGENNNRSREKEGEVREKSERHFDRKLSASLNPFFRYVSSPHITTHAYNISAFSFSLFFLVVSSIAACAAF